MSNIKYGDAEFEAAIQDYVKQNPLMMMGITDIAQDLIAKGYSKDEIVKMLLEIVTGTPSRSLLVYTTPVGTEQ